jgi:hypothetical protein
MQYRSRAGTVEQMRIMAARSSPYISNLKGVGKVYQLTAIDVATLGRSG